MFKIFKWLLEAFLVLACVVIIVLSGTYLYLSPALPSVESLREVKLQIPLRVYSQDEKLIAEYGEMHRKPLPYDQFPSLFIQAILAAEDDNFLNHHGVDPSSLIRASSELLLTGKIKSGGSTITMQVAKNFFLTPERTFARKFNEILLALKIDQKLSKQEILELYLNKIFMGNRSYGVEAAAQTYYGQSIKDLNLSQMATIAGLPKAPSKFNPLSNPKRSLERRDWILWRMLSLGYVSKSQYEQAIREPLNAKFHVAIPEVYAPYVGEMARLEMLAQYGDSTYTGGYKVYTTVSSSLESMANSAMQGGLLDYDLRHGYRGAEKRLPQSSRSEWVDFLQKQTNLRGFEPAIVIDIKEDGIRVLTRSSEEVPINFESMKWARKFHHADSMGPKPLKPSDVVAIGDFIRVYRTENGYVFRQLPHVEGALVSLDPRDGAIKALVGGFSFEESHFNRVNQAKRQPGSSFKPFIYAASLDNGFNAASIINDSPLIFHEVGMSEAWQPKNDNNTFLGPIRLREALYRSRNLVSIRVLQAMGIDTTLAYLKKFGFNEDDLPKNLSLALGTASLTPLEIAKGWAMIANGGYEVSPYLIERITDQSNQTLYLANPPTVPNRGIDTAKTIGRAEPKMPRPEAKKVIDERTTFILTDMLKDVVKKGTGRKAMILKRQDLAGKTGTTNDSKDSWFSGFNADYVTTVWCGFDQPESLGKREFGGTVALPIWIGYMGAALKDKPEHSLAQPPGIVSLTIGQQEDYDTGELYGGIKEIFKTEVTPFNSKSPGYEAPVSDPSLQEELNNTPIDLF